MAVERSPSSVLPLRRAERSVGLDDARAHPDGCRDELNPEAEGRDRHQSDEVRWEPSAWDAWDGARPDEEADAERLVLLALLADAGAEKSAGRELGGRVQDELFPELQREQWARQDAAAELCTRGADRSAERSCAEQAAAAAPKELRDAVQPA